MSQRTPASQRNPLVEGSREAGSRKGLILINKWHLMLGVGENLQNVVEHPLVNAYTACIYVSETSQHEPLVVK